MAKLRYMYSATNETYKDSAFTFIPLTMSGPTLSLNSAEKESRL